MADGWGTRDIQGGVETLLRGWIRQLRDHPSETHLDWQYWNAYYWNERDYQWALLQYMRKNFRSAGFGSPWWIHAEGTWSRPKGAHKKHWKVRKRSDIVVVDHSRLRASIRSASGDPRTVQLEAAIELKLTWAAGKTTETLIKHDLKKLNDIVRSGQAKAGYLVWLEGLRGNGERRGFPYFSREDVASLRSGLRGVRVLHWPEPQQALIWEGDDAIFRKGIRAAKIGTYPPR